MKWSLCAGALSVVAMLVACSDDEGAPGPGGTGSSTSSSGGSGTGGGNGDGGANVAEAGTGTGKKKNAEVGCSEGTECESGVCFLGNGQHFCTVNCSTANAATVCVAPFTGTCNKQGFCKRD